MKLVILDRDGVINHDSDQYIKSPEEWKPIPGSLAAIARLNQAGYRVVVASNQSGVGRGLFETDTLMAIHDKMIKALAQVGGRIDAIFFCPHTNADNCDCRKPKPGMILEAAAELGINLKKSFMVGDRKSFEPDVAEAQDLARQLDDELVRQGPSAITPLVDSRVPLARMVELG